MTLQIHLIPNDVIPKASLPELDTVCGTRALLVCFGKVGLEGVHDLAKVAFSCWSDE